MIKRHKDLLRALVGELRRSLAGTPEQRGDLDRELDRLGIAPEGKITPLDALPNPTPAERRARRVADARIEALPLSERVVARAELVEQAAYSWINRLLALRAMEARGLIEETLRANPEYDGISEALYVLRQTEPASAGGADAGWWMVIERACVEHAKSLPGLFDPSDPTTALRPSTPALLRAIERIGGKLPGFSLEESDAAFAEPDAIGWAYQFYQEEAKARVYAKLGSGGKVTSRADIAAATQLFTEPYMVQWLLQNSLGRSYHEAYPESKLPATWSYYIKPDSETERPAFGSQHITLPGLTVLDPCMGSGHFLREAFDMLAAMYREQYPAWGAAQIADTILRDHLFGIDIDPRATQLAALTLYLRAREMVRDEQRTRRMQGAGDYRPPAMNLATTPTGLSAGALERHLQRHPGDRIFKPLLEGIFAALEQADILGSLLHPSEHLDKAIAALQRPHTTPLPFDSDESALRGTMTEMARQSPAALKRLLLDRIANSFAAEGGDSDVIAALFGREAERGIRLLQVLDRRYAVVVTNPPYMGSGDFSEQLGTYINRYYTLGKGDLYAAFMLRCTQICQEHGRVAMVTRQSWMFQGTFTDLRAVSEDKLQKKRKEYPFTGFLRETRIESLAHLGAGAFEEITGEVVQAVMFILSVQLPSDAHRLTAFRIIGPKTMSEKIRLFESALKGGSPDLVYQTLQKRLIDVPLSPLSYWLRERFLELLGGMTLGSVAVLTEPSTTGDSERYFRMWWEVRPDDRWRWASHGGGYTKWAGSGYWMLDWQSDGRRIKAMPGSYIRNEDLMFDEGLTYTEAASGALGVRALMPGETFAKSSPGIFPRDLESLTTMAILNCRLCSYLLRITARGYMFGLGSLHRVPVPLSPDDRLPTLAVYCVSLKQWLMQHDLIGRDYIVTRQASYSKSGDWPYAQIREVESAQALIHAIEAVVEKLALDSYLVTDEDLDAVFSETGTPSGFGSVISGYDATPSFQGIGTLSLDSASRAIAVGLPLQIVSRSHREITRTKETLRALYESGPGLKQVEQATGKTIHDTADEEDEVFVGVYRPIPTETFLEELSQRLRIHPISVYWLLEELRTEGARCKPEELRLMEDRLSVLVLRLLGHRWPKQIEAGELVPEWADTDGVIPLIGGTGEQTLVERLRARLRTEDGELEAQKTEALLQELTGQALEEWLRRRFFERHVRQFKYRPIAWHLASTPLASPSKKRVVGRSIPAFECLLYYQATDRDVLARIRTQYVEPLLRQDRQRAADARQAGDDAAAALVTARIHELEDFVRRLREVEDEGFACAELDAAIAKEPLDRWSGDGYLPPASSEDLLHRERTWRVDINDGVRVNIAPLQIASLLASDVLKAPDAKKVIADRARWRTDERRWVREGKLPRCGWMDEDVPGSKRWTELAPQREATQMKLAAKRRAALGEGIGGDAQG